VCTLSVIRAGGDVLRVAFNRDELLARPTGLPPRVVRAGEGLAIMPIDAHAGGTWIAVNDRGLALAVLNANGPQPPPPGSTSRGTIIPRLLHCTNAADAVREAAMLPITRLAPFRLVVIDRTSRATIVSDGSTATTHLVEEMPVIFTSSGLGDHVVEQPRRELFREMGVSDAAGQDAFHRHRWPGRPHVSVSMSRPAAATVSRTVIELGDTAVSMRHTDLAPGGTETSHVRLDLQRTNRP